MAVTGFREVKNPELAAWSLTMTSCGTSMRLCFKIGSGGYGPTAPIADVDGKGIL